MLAQADIQRSIAHMSISIARSMEKRKTRADQYKSREEEWQAQFEFFGDVGTEPVETLITINFDVVFFADAGMARDSNLDRPLVKLSTEKLVASPGFITYHHLDSWLLNDDRDFVGAVVLVGVFCPAFGVTPPASTAFHYILHAAFQGYGAVWDPDGPFDSGGSVDNAGS